MNTNLNSDETHNTWPATITAGIPKTRPEIGRKAAPLGSTSNQARK